MELPRATRVVERDLRMFVKVWHAFTFSTFVTPILFLAAMGVGLGGMVDDGPGDVAGMSYLHFVTPGLLVAAAMLQASAESMWAVLGGVKWDHRYEAMTASPLDPSDVFLGFVSWITWKSTASMVVFLLVAAVLGGLESPWAVLALPVGVLTALAFAAPLAAFSITRDSDAAFAMIMRLGVMPLFLFSGTFFPVANLPGWLQPVAWFSPLWHGVELARHATTGDAHWAGDAVHLAVLVAIVVVGSRAAIRTFTARLHA